MIVMNMFCLAKLLTHALQHCTTVEPVAAAMMKTGHFPTIFIPLTLKSEAELWHFMALVILSA